MTGDWCLVDWHLVDWWLVKLIDWCLVDWWLDDWWLVTGGLRLYQILSTQRCHLDGSYPGSIAIWGGAPISKELSYNPSRVDKFFTISFSTMRIFSQLKISANKSPGKTYRNCWITWNEKNKNILHIYTRLSNRSRTSVVPNSESRENACGKRPVKKYMKSKIENFK